MRATDLVDNRAYLEPPERKTYPLVTVMRVGGGLVIGGQVPIDEALMQLDVYGEKASDRYDVGDLANALATAVESMASGTPMGDDAVGMGAKVQSGPLWRPHPDSHAPRYVLTVEIGIRPA